MHLHDLFAAADVRQRHDHLAIASDTAREIDEEVRGIVEGCYETARDILKKREPQLHKMAEALIELETLTPEQADDIMAGKPPRVIEAPVEAPADLASQDEASADGASADETSEEDQPAAPDGEREARPRPRPIGGPAEEH